jgi:hypothetical protein
LRASIVTPHCTKRWQSWRRSARVEANGSRETRAWWRDPGYGALPGPADLRAKSKLSSRIKLICPVQSPLQKYFCFSEMQIKLYDLSSRPERGALRNVINAGRGAVDADGAFDESARGGRQSRVVLTSRCWCQVRERQLSRATVAKEPFTGESTL